MIVLQDAYIIHSLQKSNIDINNIIIITPQLDTKIEDQTAFHATIEYITNLYNNNPNLCVFFNSQSEGLQYNYLEAEQRFICALMKTSKIQEVNFHHITSACHTERTIEAYKNLCDKYGWKKINLWFDNCWETRYINRSKSFEINFNRKSKKILFFNGNPRTHRVGAIAHLLQKNLLNKTYTSLTEWRGHPEGYLHEFEQIISKDEAANYCTTLAEHQQLFPLKLTRNSNNQFIINDDDMLLFNDTVVSLVAETHYSYKDAKEFNYMDTLTYPCTFPTEKFYKTFQAFHPFIVLSTPYFLEDIRCLGYKTFHPHIDESYDLMEDDQLRFKAVMSQVERVCNMTDEEILEFQINTKDILYHNYQVNKNKLHSIVHGYVL